MHSFHIPVMGLAFTVDTPLKVAQLGISSAVSLSSDSLLEDLRAHYSRKHKLPYTPISTKENDYRARRITAYLDMLHSLVEQQMRELRSAPLEPGSPLTYYLELLPENSPLKINYAHYLQAKAEVQKEILETLIRRKLTAGAIDVNIMTKVNRSTYDKEGKPLPPEFAEALAALRGFARSQLSSSVIFSAGLNPRLYSYTAEFPDFFPDENAQFKKKVILKVSDYRSALIQGKFLAKKGIWISEFRIESGLNCGGHAFATDGLLLGPILEEFKTNRENLRQELYELCRPVWQQKNLNWGEEAPPVRITVQGGIGTAAEHEFLIRNYGVEATGWGTPFLLVPEATSVDEPTLQKLMAAKAGDLYLSKSSPLGVPFNNLRDSASELVREERITKERPGSPCHKKYLVSNTEFTKEPICTASRQYQHLKLKELDEKQLPEHEHLKAREEIVVKACLCEDLAAPSYIDHSMKAKVKAATAICPGPNLAYFSGRYSLREMTSHIYGRHSLLNETCRPHMFLNELKMYIHYLEQQWKDQAPGLSDKKAQYFRSFKANLEEGVAYYEGLSAAIASASFQTELSLLKKSLREFSEPVPVA